MKTTEIHARARQLREAHGEKARLEAAQKAIALLKEGDEKQAQEWRRIEAALTEMQGPRAT